MKPNPSQLSPLIRSDVQGLILARLFMAASDEFSVTELSEYSFTSVPTAMREVDRLIEAEYVTERTLGRVRLIRANQDHPMFNPIFQIVAYSYGPAAVLPSALSNLFGLQEAYLYGPWAAKLAQQAGPNPTDIDVVLIGNMVRIDATRVLANAERVIGRTINVQFSSNFDWDRGESEFIRKVKASPMLKLALSNG